ncbi:MAG: hypothetical protein IKQ27_14325 [Lachnospiraceae bacterium]|nr:hypothetical protein [Lachnospiraceae bacterium]
MLWYNRFMSEKKKSSDAQLRAQQKYDKVNTRNYHLKLNRNTDADVIEKLDSVESIQGYIKGLVRDDISRKDK